MLLRHENQFMKVLFNTFKRDIVHMKSLFSSFYIIDLAS